MKQCGCSDIRHVLIDTGTSRITQLKIPISISKQSYLLT